MKQILFLHDPLSRVPATLLSSLINLASADHSHVKVLLLGKMELADRQQLKESLQGLERQFIAAGIKFSFSEDVLSLEEILRQSVYADLIVADALLNIPGPAHPSLNVSIKELLTDAHCPVLQLREGDMPPDRIMLSYDGSYSSMQAIRSFSYLFPNLCYIPNFVVYVAGKEQKEPADLHYLKDWLPLHFDNPTVEVLPGEPAEVLPAFAGKVSGSTLVVMGAYGRSDFSGRVWPIPNWEKPMFPYL